MYNYHSELGIFDINFSHVQLNLSFGRLEFWGDFSRTNFNSLSPFLLDYSVLMDGNDSQGFSNSDYASNHNRGDTPLGPEGRAWWWKSSSLSKKGNTRFGDEDVTYAKPRGGGIE